MIYAAVMRHIIANGLGMALSLAYQIIVGRWLSSADFAHLQALFSWQTVINGVLSYTVLVQTQRVTAMEISGNFHQIALQTTKLFKISGYIAFVSVIFISAAKQLDATELSQWFAYLSYVALAFILSLISAVTSGLRWYSLLSLQSLLPHITKLAVTCVSVYLGLDFFGVVAALPVSVFVLNLILLWQLRSRLLALTSDPAKALKTPENPALRNSLRNLTSLAIGNVAIAVASNLDILLVTALISNDEAGAYVKLSILAKFYMYLAASAGGIIFPASTHSKLSSSSIQATILKMLIFAIGSGIVFIIGFYFLAQPLRNLVFGAAQSFNTSTLILTATYSVLVGLYIMLFNYLAGLSTNWYNYICAGILVLAGTVPYLFIVQLNIILIVATVGVGICAAVGLLAAASKKDVYE